MALDAKVKKLAIDVALKRPSGNFSLDELEDTLRTEIANLVCNERGSIDFYKWQANSKMVFELMATMVDEILPQNVSQAFGPFADFMIVNHGDKPRFTLKKGVNNVKRFVTKVAAAGVYERVRLDRDYVDVETYAHGGAIYQTLEGFLSGRESISDLLNIFVKELENSAYEDLTVALQSTMVTMPAANKHTSGGFVAAEFDRILNTVRAYGQPTIFATMAFASSIIPEEGFIGDMDKADMRNLGYIGRYKGADVVIIPQSFTDSTNSVKVIDDQFAYIIPSGSFEKPVKVVYEGDTLIREVEREDWSIEMQIYKKMGIAILNTNHFGIYQNTAL
jgi:hypothetical protein